MTQAVESEVQEFSFTVDSALLRELGERLVSTVHVALSELVKNSYDADATTVKVRIEEQEQGGPLIVVEDNGSGMSPDAVSNFWMRIGTTNKEDAPRSERFGRPRTGRKGVGRFACRRLGTVLVLETLAHVQRPGRGKETARTTITFDWTAFVPGEEVESVTCHGDIEYAPGHGPSGTRLEITGASDNEWETRGYNYVRRQLAVIASNAGARREGFEEDPGFTVELDTPEGDVAMEANAADPPDLFMIDHDLQQAIRQGGLQLKGSSLAHLLRLNLPNTPIVCVSNQSMNSRDFDWEQLSEYTHVFPLSQLNHPEHIELFAIALDYPKICFGASDNVRREIVNALAPPEADREALFAVLPEEFEAHVEHQTTPHRIARWILNVFMDRPGFLLDALGAATLVGLKVEAFLRIAPPLFAEAEYRGPFATAARKLWWASQLGETLYARLPQEASLPPQLAGRKLPDVTPQDYSICGATGESLPPPDVVAYLDEQKRERVAMRSERTEPIGADSVLGFAPRLKLRRAPR